VLPVAEEKILPGLAAICAIITLESQIAPEAGMPTKHHCKNCFHLKSGKLVVFDSRICC
jgi:hypothetical protein